MSSTGIGVGASMIFGGVKASPSFEYSGSAFCTSESDPTPTINGTPGGTFTAAPVAPNTGTLVINSGTGTVDLSASDVGNYLVTYTVGGKSESDPFEVLSVQSTAFSYTEPSFAQSGTASPTITGTSGGVFSATSGIIFSDTSSNTGSSTGVINLAASTVGGPYTVTYTNTGACQGTPSTFNISVTAAYASTSSFSFDGVNDYFDAGNDSSLSFGTGNFSISCWFKTTQNVSGAVDLVINGAFGGGGKNYVLFLDGGEKVGFAIDDGNDNPFVKSTNSVADGNWHNVVGVRDSVNINLYLDGSFIASTTDTTDTSIDSTSPLLIGAGTTVNTGVIGNFFEGLIDEVSIWDSALSGPAVTEIFNEQPSGSGKPNDLTSLTNASSSNLKAWYKM